jgi:hypothetical protein
MFADRTLWNGIQFETGEQTSHELTAQIAQRDTCSRKRPAGATPPTFSRICRLAGPVPLHCIQLRTSI